MPVQELTRTYSYRADPTQGDTDAIATVVLGLKRGGTSVTAGVLHRLGVCMGKELAPPDEHNPDGYFEDLEFARIVDGLLAGASIHNGRLVDRSTESLRQLVAARCGSGSWGVKNFGLAYILPELTDLIDVRLLLVERPFSEAAESWARRGRSLGEAITEEAHLLFNIDKSYAQHTGPKATVRYHDLLTRPEQTVRLLASWVGAPYSEEAVALIRTRR
jgi:hypothetical protein